MTARPYNEVIFSSLSRHIRTRSATEGKPIDQVYQEVISGGNLSSSEKSELEIKLGLRSRPKKVRKESFYDWREGFKHNDPKLERKARREFKKIENKVVIDPEINEAKEIELTTRKFPDSPNLRYGKVSKGQTSSGSIGGKASSQGKNSQASSGQQKSFKTMASGSGTSAAQKRREYTSVNRRKAGRALASTSKYSRGGDRRFIQTRSGTVTTATARSSEASLRAAQKQSSAQNAEKQRRQAERERITRNANRERLKQAQQQQSMKDRRQNTKPLSQKRRLGETWEPLPKINFSVNLTVKMGPTTKTNMTEGRFGLKSMGMDQKSLNNDLSQKREMNSAQPISDLQKRRNQIEDKQNKIRAAAREAQEQQARMALSRKIRSRRFS